MKFLIYDNKRKLIGNGETTPRGIIEMKKVCKKVDESVCVSKEEFDTSEYKTDKNNFDLEYKKANRMLEE